MREMTDTLQTTTQQPRSSTGSWMVLVIGTMVTFLLGVGTQLVAFFSFGLCTEADQSTCPPGSVATTWEWVLVTVPSYLLWVAPSVVAGLLGYRVLRSGNPAGRVVMVVAAVAAVLVTIGCAVMWWL